MLAGQPASAVLQPIEPISAELFSRIAQNPAYGSFDMDAVREDLLAVIAHGLSVTVKTLDTWQLPSERELRHIGALTVRQANNGVPLSAILALTAQGISAFRSLAVDRAHSNDVKDLEEFNHVILALAQRMHTFISLSYLAVVPSVPQTDARTTHRVVDALLAGEEPGQVARQAGIELPSAFLVLRLCVAPEQRSPQVDAHQRIQAHRNLAAAVHMLASHYGAGLLDAPPPHRGLVLIAGKPEWKAVGETIKKIKTELGIRITAVGEQADLDQVAAAALTTRELAGLVDNLDLPHALYRMDDLALEYQLTRPGPARESFAKLLAPLADFPELLQTLSVHLAHDQNRKRTASLLSLHTNTVDNRIKRVAQLTGLDPTLPSELFKLRAAMIAVAGPYSDSLGRPGFV